MKSLKCFVLLFFVMAFSTVIYANDGKYLEGAVPVVNGKVTFAKEFTVQGVSKDEIYTRLVNWLEIRFAEGEEHSRLLFSDKEMGEIAGLGQEYLVFQSSFLSLDRSLLEYYVIVECKDESCSMTVDRIKFDYEGETHPAEEWITDEYALNKSKTKLVRGLAKFRRFTVDYMEKFFDDAASALAKSTKVVLKTDIDTSISTNSNQLVEQKKSGEVIKSSSTSSTPLVALQPAVTVKETAMSISNELAGFKTIDPLKIPGNIIKMLAENWMLITAGDSNKFNMMTASWGGLGRLYEKPTTTCFIYPTRYTYQLMEYESYYTLTFFTEAYHEKLSYCGNNTGKDIDKVQATGLTPITTPNGAKAFAEAWLVIECKKMVSQTLTPEALVDDDIRNEWLGKQLHKMYIGEITNVWVK